MRKIHPTACISPNATLGDNIEIGPYTIIHDNVVLGNKVRVESYCELGLTTNLSDGSPLIIGDHAFIRSHSVFYESSQFGDGLVTGHHVIVREHTVAKEYFQIGTFTEIQGDCEIGQHVKFQSNIFVAKKTKFCDFIWVLPYAIFTNDPTPPSDDHLGIIVESFASICASAVIMPGVHIGTHSLVCASACVTKDVPAYMAVSGVPATIKCETKAIRRRDGSNRSAYPWNKHFHRGYPKEVVQNWITLEGETSTGGSE